MKFETIAGKLYNTLLFKIGVPFTGRTISLNFSVYTEPNVWTFGYSSRTKSGRYVLFHDYDHLELEDVIEELKYLQEQYKLSDYYIFKLDRDLSYHAVCLDTFSLRDVFKIQKQTSCDNAFISSIFRLKTKEWILRISEKGLRAGPKFLKRIDSSFDNRIKSTAHSNIVKKLGGKINKKGKWDNITDIGLIKYNTASRTK